MPNYDVEEKRYKDSDSRAFIFLNANNENMKIIECIVSIINAPMCNYYSLNMDSIYEHNAYH